MSPGRETLRHSPDFRATQYLYESAAVSLRTSPVAALLASIKGCIPQYAQVGCIFRLITPRNPEEPPRLSEPLAAHAPELATQLHSGVEPPGNSVPTAIGQLSALIVSPLV